jgi:hypothetical protein
MKLNERKLESKRSCGESTRLCFKVKFERRTILCLCEQESVWITELEDASAACGEVKNGASTLCG